MGYYKTRTDGSAIHIPDSLESPKKRPSLFPVVLVAVALLGAAVFCGAVVFWVAPRFFADTPVATTGTPAEQIARLMVESAATGDVLTTAMAPGPTEEEALDNAFIRATMAGVQGDPSTQTVAQVILPTSERVTLLYPQARFVAIVVFLNTVEDEAAEGT